MLAIAQNNESTLLNGSNHSIPVIAIQEDDRFFFFIPFELAEDSSSICQKIAKIAQASLTQGGEIYLLSCHSTINDVEIASPLIESDHPSSLDPNEKTLSWKSYWKPSPHHYQPTIADNSISQNLLQKIIYHYEIEFQSPRNANTLLYSKGSTLNCSLLPLRKKSTADTSLKGVPPTNPSIPTPRFMIPTDLSETASGILLCSPLDLKDARENIPSFYYYDQSKSNSTQLDSTNENNFYLAIPTPVTQEGITKLFYIDPSSIFSAFSHPQAKLPAVRLLATPTSRNPHSSILKKPLNNLTQEMSQSLTSLVLADTPLQENKLNEVADAPIPLEGFILKFKKFKYLIPLGDHCAVTMILKDLNLRRYAYPFDWCSSTSQLTGSNLEHVASILQRKLKKNLDNGYLIQEMIGNAMDTNEKTNANNDLWFPHDFENTPAMYEKYTRRFTRLIEHITSKDPCLYIYVNRYADPSPSTIIELADLLISYNSESKILLLLGKKQDIENKNVICKHFPYDPAHYYSYDYSHFRPEISKYFQTLK